MGKIVAGIVAALIVVAVIRKLRHPSYQHLLVDDDTV